MIGLIQLVSNAQVVIDNQEVAAITRGILALVGLEKTDNESTAKKLIDRILTYRIFPDEDNKMNLCLKDINGDLLLVPQFTLVAETNKGTRPGFSKGMPPKEGGRLFNYIVEQAKNMHANTESGKFGAYMQVTLCNDGPATFILSV